MPPGTNLGEAEKYEMEIQANKLLNEKDAAKLLGVSVSTLRRWRRLGSGPVYRKLNGAVRYSAVDLQKFIDDRARVSTQAQHERYAQVTA